MKCYHINFELDKKEKIIVQLTSPLHDIYCCDRASIVWTNDYTSYVLLDDSVFPIYNMVQVFIILLNKSLSNKLQLHQSLTTMDIGYLYNEDLQNKPGLAYEQWEGEEYPLWVGYKYFLWAGNDVQSWIYNNNAGDIVFEITPNFPEKLSTNFSNNRLSIEKQKNHESYKKWIQEYRPLLIRTIPREVAEQWLDKANQTLKTIEKNIGRVLI